MEPGTASSGVPARQLQRVTSSGPGRPISADAIPSKVNPLESGGLRTTRFRGNRRLACRSCRQAKIKCDTSQTVSGRCRRCRERNEECHTDANFKRISRRMEVINLQQEIQQLSSIVDTNSGIDPGAAEYPPASQPKETEIRDQMLQSESSHHEDLMSGVLENVEPTPIVRFHSSGSSYPAFMLERDPNLAPAIGFETSSSKTLGDVSISYVDEKELFRIFFAHYHPFFALLDPSVSSEIYHDRSPILFWAIISVAARNYSTEPTLITSIAFPFMTFLWKRISAFPPTLDLVQAILLLCTWPFPNQSMSTDPSFTLISVAKSFILQLGLHRPETVQDFLREKTQLGAEDIQQAVRIWAGCHIAAQSVSVSVGLNSVCTVDWAIDRACQTGTIYELPLEFRHRLLIQQFSSNISQSMSANRQSATGLPGENELGTTLALLERNYDELHRQLEGNITDINKIMLCCSSLQLRAFYFFEKSELRERGILKAYSTALSMINMTHGATETYGFMIYSSSHFGRELLLAAIIVLKVLYSKFVVFVDFTEGKRAFNYAVSLLRKASIEDNDLNGRSSKILAQLWGAYNTHATKARSTKEPSVRLRSRSSASVMHDELWAWRERFAKQSSSAEHSAPLRPPISALTPNSAWGSSPEITSGPNTGSMVDEQMLDNDFTLDFDFDYLGSGWDINIASLLPLDLGG